MRLNIWKMKPMWSARNASRRAPRRAETATPPTVTVPALRDSHARDQVEERALAAARGSLEEDLLPLTNGEPVNIEHERRDPASSGSAPPRAALGRLEGVPRKRQPKPGPSASQRQCILSQPGPLEGEPRARGRAQLRRALPARQDVLHV